HGAVRLLGDGYDRLLPFRPACMGIELEPALDGVAGWRRLLALADENGDWTVDSLSLPRLELAQRG
ncbi:MAG: hypothetical protein M3021_09265, partial [Actinomycetota bacterium]|nr:hypothetical protein [Actinomycetota bacterium]